NQAGALVHVYADGSVQLNHGGTEMGQGLMVKVAQVVAAEVGLTLDAIRIMPTSTAKVPNTSATCASAGVDLNGMAARHAPDTLTGESRILRVDILHDCGRSLNPAIDLGQIEGGFIQGMGWLTTEELWFDDKGRLRTHAPSTYKIPVAGDRPEMHMALWDGEN